MPSQTPLLLIDNWLDTIGSYPNASLLTSSEAVGREALHVADYRRERTYWMPQSAGERPHLDFTTNAAAGADQRVVAMAANVLARANTSHTFAFLLQSTGDPAAGVQRLLSIGAGAAAGGLFGCYYSVFGGRLGFINNGTAYDYGSGAVYPNDGNWHTLIFVFDAAAAVSKVYVDGVQVGTAAGIAYIGQTIGGASGGCTMMGAWNSGTGSWAQCVTGRLGRVLYYSGAQNSGGVAVIHSALLNEDRSAGNGANSTATYQWDPYDGQATQALPEKNGGPAWTIGRSSSVEGPGVYDALWNGGHYVGVDLGAVPAAAPNALWIDRGHNLWGTRLVVEGDGGNNTFQGTSTSRCVPARDVPALDANGNYVVGGDPTTGVCVTEEGALYMLFGAPIGSRWTRVRFLAPSKTFTPIVPGVILGQRLQLLGYSNTFDEDARDRKVRTEESDAGYLATGRAYSHRILELDLQLIGDTEYDAALRAARALMFDQNQPFVAVLNYGDYPARAWLYQEQSAQLRQPKRTMYRSTKITAREVGALVR